MPRQAQIEPGAAVEATDGRFGRVEEIIVRPSSGELAYLVVRHGDETVTLPIELVAEVVSPLEVRLALTRDAARARLAGSAASAAGQSSIRVPVYEEQLRLETRSVDLGELRLHKYVEHVEQTLRLPVERDDVEIERVRVDRPLDAPALPRHEDGWYVLPVMEEVLVVSKRLMLTEEVRVRTRRVVEQQEVSETVRREHVGIEDATVHGVRNLDGVPGAVRTEPPARASEQANGR